MYFSRFLTFWSLFAVLVVFGNANPGEKLFDGQEVDTLRQFPFFVYITADNRKCGGSILNAQWILTSAGCVKGYTRVELNFGRKNERDNTAGYFSISVNSEQVYVYPTNHDDLALIKIPTRLVFSDTVSPVNISRSSIDALRNKFAVLPGFDSYGDEAPPTPPITPSPPPGSTPAPYTTTLRPINADNLKYGMFNILDQSVCRNDLAAYNFNEYNQLCAEGWGSNPNTPCGKDFGSPLIVGWPAKSELVGVFSTFSPSCFNNNPFAFSFVPKYLTWIESMIQG